MIQTLIATFDGNVLRPEGPLNLQPNTKVRITVETPDVQLGAPYSFLDLAASLNLEGPSDMSTNWEKYLNENERPRE
jgi:hypothetical protein